jgi:hypothetical protein
MQYEKGNFTIGIKAGPSPNAWAHEIGAFALEVG